MRQLFFSMLVLLTISTQAQQTIIEGKIINGEEYTNLELGRFFPDSVYVSTEMDSTGIFRIEADIAEKDIFKLQFVDGLYLMVVISPGDHIIITFDLDDIFATRIEGSPESQDIYSVQAGLNKYDEKIEACTQQYEAQREKEMVKYIDKNSGSLTILFFLDKLEINEHFELFKKCSANLSTKHPSHPVVKELVEMVDDFERLAPDSPAPDISMPDTAGNTLNLSDYKGKIVIIDFWAFKCTVCHSFHEDLKILYEKYHDKGLEILSVSLDYNHSDWISGIIEYNLPWIHICDLKFRESSVVEDYDIQGLPEFFLIDKDGNIILENITIEELKEELAKLFGH